MSRRALPVELNSGRGSWEEKTRECILAGGAGAVLNVVWQKKQNFLDDD